MNLRAAWMLGGILISVFKTTVKGSSAMALNRGRGTIIVIMLAPDDGEVSGRWTNHETPDQTRGYGQDRTKRFGG